MPSSLAVIHSSTLGSSPRPPVSVYGTGSPALIAPWLFSRVWLPALSARPKTRRTVGFHLRYVLQPSLPYDGGSVTPRSPACLRGTCRNVDRLYIACSSRIPLSPRLTLIRLTLFRNPWAFGVSISMLIIVTYAYIFFSCRSNIPHGTSSARHQCSPTARIAPRPRLRRQSYARSSSTPHRSTSELLRTL